MTEKQKRDIFRTRSPHHRVIYANQTGMTVTNVDIRIRFGCVEKADSAAIHVEDQVDVILGPVELHALHALLERHLEKFPINPDIPLIEHYKPDGKDDA